MYLCLPEAGAEGRICVHRRLNMIFYIKHIPIEGPETLGEFFHSEDFSARIVDLSQGQALPGSLHDLEAVICLGGPMNVYEEDQYPFLKQETIFLRKVMAKNIPLLGICLGAQMIAKACGAKVKKSPVTEIGWRNVRLTQDGKDDAIFEGMGPELKVFQWHGDTFELPRGATLLARGRECVSQAFCVGPHTYGFQFHVEVTAKNISEWADAYLEKGRSQVLLRQKMLADYKKNKETFSEQAARIYNNFLRIINAGSTKLVGG